MKADRLTERWAGRQAGRQTDGDRQMNDKYTAGRMDEM